MKSLKPLALTALALLLTGSGAGAQQTVYRCGNSYSQSPCAHGVAVQTDDPRTEAQRAAAREGLAHDKALAKEMGAARHKDEAQAMAQDKLALARAAAAAAHQKQDKKSIASKKAVHAKPRTVKVKDAEFFTATDGASNKKKTTSKTVQP